MPFVHQPIGALVATNPRAAFEELSALFAKHGTREAVSKAIQVDARTISRWIIRLVDAGVGDPRQKIIEQVSQEKPEPTGT